MDNFNRSYKGEKKSLKNLLNLFHMLYIVTTKETLKDIKCLCMDGCRNRGFLAGHLIIKKKKTI